MQPEPGTGSLSLGGTALIAESITLGSAATELAELDAKEKHPCRRGHWSHWPRIIGIASIPSLLVTRMLGDTGNSMADEKPQELLQERSRGDTAEATRNRRPRPNVYTD